MLAGKTVRWEFHVARNGKTYDLISAPLKNSDGSISKLEIFRDITERKIAREKLRHAKEAAEAANRDLVRVNQQLTREIAVRTEMQRNLRLLEMAVTQTEEGIAIADMNGYNQFVNKAWAEMHGYTKEELPGTHLSMFHTEGQYQEQVRPFIEQVMKTGHHQGEDVHLKKDGTLFYTWMSVNLVKNDEGHPIAIVGACRDITTLREARESLRKAKEAAEAANRAKSTFLAHMSHELRTPLNGILGYAQILRRGRSLTTAQTDGLNVIYKSGHHLLTLISDILDLAKVEAGKLELVPAPVGLPGFLDGVTGIMRMAAQQKDIEFVSDVPDDLPAAVEADEKRLRQVLLNLLGNAVKFTDEGSVTFEIRQTCEVFKTSQVSESPQVSLGFEIRDTGVGMTPGELTKIFRPFEQVGDEKRRAEGTGLGLAITRQLVNLMHGEIRAESEPGRGSAFRFEIVLPVLKEAVSGRQIPKSRQVAGYEGERRKVLIADDTEDNRLVLRDLLEPLGFDISLAVNGKEGVGQAQAIRPDMILMDLMMPVMNGFEAVKAIRGIPEIMDVPIIAISASAFDTDREKSRTAGCQEFLPKPVKPDRLLVMMEKYMGLEWVYEETEAAPETTLPVVVSADEIIPPPPADLEVLYELTMFGDLGRVEEKARQLEDTDARYAPFVHKVCGHAREFEDERILKLLKRFMKSES